MNRKVSVAEVFDTSGFTLYQFLVCSMCFLVTFLDGFDISTIALAAPKMAEYLHAKPSALGIAMSAGQFGPLIGAIVLGTLADRFGRKWMLAISALIFGIFTWMTASITSVEQLALYRFLAGLGLGGAVPNALAFGSEYAPARSRSTFVTTMYAGMPGGGVLCGFASMWFIPHLGWQSVFVLGGVIPVAIAILVGLALPESLDFLVRQGKAEKRIRKIVGRIAPQLANDPGIELVSSEKKLPSVPVKSLFTEGRAFTTVLLWIGLTASLYTLWVMTSWAPMLLKMAGAASVQQYLFESTAVGFGAIASALFVGRLMDRVNQYRVLAIGYVVGFLCLSAFGMCASCSFLVVVTTAILCGIFLNGSHTGFLALVTTSYPPSMRGTGTGWAYAIAKIGAMAAPAVGGILLSRNWSAGWICTTNAAACLVAAMVALILGGRAFTAVAKKKPEIALDVKA